MTSAIAATPMAATNRSANHRGAVRTGRFYVKRMNQYEGRGALPDKLNPAVLGDTLRPLCVHRGMELTGHSPASRPK